jgi:hypothetical protein
MNHKKAVEMYLVMAGLVPAIHVFLPHRRFKDVDARDEPGHDDVVAASGFQGYSLRNTLPSSSG